MKNQSVLIVSVSLLLVFGALSLNAQYGLLFSQPNAVYHEFSYNTGGWRVEKHPRKMADVNGDGKADIVAFGTDEVFVALGQANGTFAPRKVAYNRMTFNNTGWRVENHVREVADVNGDGRADIVGFGTDVVHVALGKADGTFANQITAFSHLCHAQGWKVESHPRKVADVNGDGRADIVGFGESDIFIILGQPDGTFATTVVTTNGFTINRGGWKVEKHMREVADVNGDGRADIVGLRNDFVYVGLGQADGSVAAPQKTWTGMCYDQGWKVERHPRKVADVNGDGRADIIGFGENDIYVAFGQADGTFAAAIAAYKQFTFSAGWRVELHVREVADVTGDGKADIVGFGTGAVFVALSKGNPPPIKDRIETGQRLHVGERIVSGNGLYQATVQPDGNFVVHGTSGALWASNTRGRNSNLVLQGDGNLVLRAQDVAKALWASNTQKKSNGGTLIMQNDGNLVLYAKDGKALWASNTVQTAIEEGFRVAINGLHCLQTGDGGNGTDEPYIEVYVDGKLRTTYGPRPMNENDRGLWEKFTDNVESLTRLAQQEYWLLPGSVYAEEKVEIKLWEKDGGRDSGGLKDKFTDNDDYIGNLIITRSTEDSDYIKKDFNSAGSWSLVCTKASNRFYDAGIKGSSKLVNVRVPVLNQGNEGACVAFATVGALTTVYLNDVKPGNSKEDLFDPFALYGRRANPQSSGWNIRPCLEEIMKNGIPFRSDPNKRLWIKDYYKYDKDGIVRQFFLDGNGDVSNRTVEQRDNNGHNKMRAVIRSGEPLIARYDVYDDFMAYAGVQGVYGGNIASDSRDSGHAVFVIGYENPAFNADGTPKWVLQNSWAPQWGNNGTCKFIEGACGFDDSMYRIGEYEIR